MPPNNHPTIYPYAYHNSTISTIRSYCLSLSHLSFLSSLFCLTFSNNIYYHSLIVIKKRQLHYYIILSPHIPFALRPAGFTPKPTCSRNIQASRQFTSPADKQNQNFYRYATVPTIQIFLHRHTTDMQDCTVAQKSQPVIIPSQ